MVATKLSEVAGMGWRSLDTSAGNSKSKSNSNSNSNGNNHEKRDNPTQAGTSSFYQSANESLQQATESAFSGISSAFLHLPSLWRTEPSAGGNNVVGNDGTGRASFGLKPTNSDDGLSSSSLSAGSGLSAQRRRGAMTHSLLSPTLLKMIHNPYIGVRGGGRQHKAKPPRESMDAVRKLLYVVDDSKKASSMMRVVRGEEGGISEQRRCFTPVGYDGIEEEDREGGDQRVDRGASIPIPLNPFAGTPAAPAAPLLEDHDSKTTPRHRNSNANAPTFDRQSEREQQSHVRSFLPPQLATIDSSCSYEENRRQQSPSSPMEDGRDHPAPMDDPSVSAKSASPKTASSYSASPEETASQLTEGTLRAMRDLALDEAVELHASLKYWSDRWERPVFSWFVAGPLVWFGLTRNRMHHPHGQDYSRHYLVYGGGYDHSVIVGRKVSQIQAVLARRLSAIGELQQHLLRAGWQRGVAQWGFLGEGGDWAAVAGTDGRMMDQDSVDQSFEDEAEDDDEGENETGDDPEHAFHYYQEDAEPPWESEISPAETDAITPRNSSAAPSQYRHHHNNRSHRYGSQLRRDYSEASIGSIGMHFEAPHPPPNLSTPRRRNLSMTGGLYDHESRRKQNSLYYTNLHVRKQNGGHIHKDDPALAEWSIDAMVLIRSQLHRAANGKIALPCAENWPFEFAAAGYPSVATAELKGVNHAPTDDVLPAWAAMKSVPSRTRKRVNTANSLLSLEDEHEVKGLDDVNFPSIGPDCFDNSSTGSKERLTVSINSVSPPDLIGPPSSRRSSMGQQQNRQRLASSSSFSFAGERSVLSISDLPLMMNEVSGLLDIMEDIIDVQRARRLEKLKPPPWWRQNWFLVAMVPPSATYLLYNNIDGKGQMWNLFKFAATKILDFAREHVVLPCVALYEEITKGPESISDRKARDTAIETLKKMLRSWLDETYPEMLEAEKTRLSDAMDITLVEEAKEQGMKSVYNMNSVIRMSFIEAQFIKKEMMNALVAMDEMQASTNFNMNLAAITPFVLLIWTVKKISIFIFYTTFKWGKSRRETYRSFLDALTEIERLLIMRSNPPAPSVIMGFNTTNQAYHHRNYHKGHGKGDSSHATPAVGDCVLGSDDLGMLMLHIHELRTILWQERRRFSPNALRSVSEDLAELSGERGAVSVRQQLLIVERMNRAYSFLKQGAID